MPFTLSTELILNSLSNSFFNLIKILSPTLINLTIEKIIGVGVSAIIVIVLSQIFSYHYATKIKDFILSVIYPILSIFSHK